MKKTLRFIVLIIAVIIILAVYLFNSKTNTQQFPVAQLLIDTDILPNGWEHNRDAPINLFLDPLINHVFRSWGQTNDGSGSAYQSIQRSKNSLQAYINYRETINSNIYFEKDPQKYLIEFYTPNEIKFTSEIANNRMLLCGWYEWSYCEFIAQYENYVVNFYTELEMDYQGHHIDGLTYNELERILQSIDEKFVKFLSTSE